VYVGACLLESPSLLRHFLAGGFVGSAAFIGVNHGMYTGVAFSCLLLFIQYRTSSCESLWKCASVWGVGILCGYVPMLFMFFSCPGFAGRYLDLLLNIWRRGTTNLPLPVPWPWQVDYLAVDWLTGVTAFVVGLAFCILPLFYGTALVLLLWRRGDVRRQSVFIASTFVGLVYMQYAFSRADLSHLAQSIHPLLLGLVALPTLCEPTRSRRTVLGIILVTLGLSLFPAYRGSPLFSTCIWRGQGCVLYVINGEELWLAESEKIGLERLRTVMTQHVIDTEGIFIAPHAPGLYCVLQKDSPVWQTYFIFPEQAEDEEIMIEALRTKKIRWALVGDVALDGREELRFRHTHTLVWQYVRQEFEPVEVEGLPLHYQLFRRKAF